MFKSQGLCTDLYSKITKRFALDKSIALSKRFVLPLNDSPTEIHERTKESKRKIERSRFYETLLGYLQGNWLLVMYNESYLAQRHLKKLEL